MNDFFVKTPQKLTAGNNHTVKDYKIAFSQSHLHPQLQWYRLSSRWKIYFSYCTTAVSFIGHIAVVSTSQKGAESLPSLS